MTIAIIIRRIVRYLTDRLGRWIDSCQESESEICPCCVYLVYDDDVTARRTVIAVQAPFGEDTRQDRDPSLFNESQNEEYSRITYKMPTLNIATSLSFRAIFIFRLPIKVSGSDKM